jgi:bacteriocin biosynthesis cyclodehydratase domain-containing protein
MPRAPAGGPAAVTAYPRLRADYSPVPLSGPNGRYLLLLGEGRTLHFESRVEIETILHLDGTARAADLVASLGARLGPMAVASALTKMGRLGLLADGPQIVPDAAAATWDARGVDPARAEDWLRDGRVLLVSSGGAEVADADQTAAMLSNMGPSVERADHDDPHLRQALADRDRLIVAAPYSMLDPWLGRLNGLCLELGRDWSIVRPHGLVLLIGPHLVPRRTGCWQCLCERWRANEQVENFVELVNPGSPRLVAARADSRPARVAALALLCAELPGVHQRGWSERISGRVVALDTRDLSTTSHELIRQPQCHACGDRAALGGRHGIQNARPVNLDRYVSPYLGIVSRLVPLDADASSPVHTYSASHAFICGADPDNLRTNLRGLSGGKGRNAEQARIAAVAEAIERTCGLWSPDHLTRRGTFDELRVRGGMHPRDLQLFSAAQYAEREAANRTALAYHRVPAPLADDTPIDWTPARSITHERQRWLPSAYCWYGHPEIEVSAADSNGCAAGTSVDDAIVRGFTELVERDSAALWWYHRSRLAGVDLATFHDPWIDRVAEHYDHDLDRSMWVLDMTADLGLPAYVAISEHRSRPAADVIFGFGCGLSAAEGVTRALAELNQFLPMVARFDGRRTRYGLASAAALTWFTEVRVCGEPWLAPDPDQEPTTASTYPDYSPGSAADRLRRCLAIAVGHGLEVITLEQSRPDIEVAVVRTVVPGLRHFWRRLGAGRLWTVPAALGRRPLAPDEKATNPHDIFF